MSAPPNRIRRLWVWVLAGLLVLGGGLLFRFDPNEYHFYPVCVFHQTTGLLCPGCGSLRAVHQLLHGNWLPAFRFNPLLVCCLPLALSFAAFYAVKWIRGQPVLKSPHSLWPWVVAFLVIGIAFGVWRNIPGSALAMLQP